MSSIPFGGNSTLSSTRSRTPSVASGVALAATPEWSHSRQYLYDTCHRALYYSTELARGGWRRDATEDARAAYRLKSLTSLRFVLGSALHERAAEMAKAVRAGDTLPTVVEMRERTRHTLNHVWSSSRRRRAEWMLQPKQVPMLREHYYGQVPTADQLARVKDRMERGLVSLNGLGLWGEIGALDPHNITFIDKLDSYLLPPAFGDFGDGGGITKVWAAPDLVVRYGDGGEILVTDYKSGPVASGSALKRHIAQVASYAVQLRVTGVLAEGEGCRGLLVYLHDGTELSFDITPHDIEAAAKRIRDGAMAMVLARTAADHAAMDALLEARAAGTREMDISAIVERARRESPGYVMTPDRTKCRDCPFADICGRHETADTLQLNAKTAA